MLRPPAKELVVHEAAVVLTAYRFENSFVVNYTIYMGVKRGW